jgi:hypothetical protein
MPAFDTSDRFQLGEPVVLGGVVVAPLFPRHTPRRAYVTADVAIPLGFRVTEFDGAGSVPELLALNPLDRDVLLYDGEELVGAKQNRILNVTVLAAAGSETRIPVSCVEEGRWSARSATFAAAPQTAYPELRRRKAERLAADPLALGAAQGVVWDEVRAKAQRTDVQSATGAHDDLYRRHERDLRSLEDAFPLQPGQCGAVLALGEKLALDVVSRPDAWARLHARIVRGYALDAREHRGGKAASTAVLDRFLAEVATAPRSRRASAGLGEDVRLRSDRVVGSALELDGEGIQLSAFTTERPATTAQSTIARPSRRR